MRLLTKQQQQEQQQQQQQQPVVIIEPDEQDQEQESNASLIISSPAISVSLSPLEISPDQKRRDDDDSELESIAASYHSGALVRAKSHSMFENGYYASAPPSRDHSYQTQLACIGTSTLMTAHSYPFQEMPTRDWVKMQSKMEALELEVSHVKRTNMLLNQELDKVNAHLTRITAQGNDGDGDGQGEGWRREYEFLVQQVDWMHRQLQEAHAATQMNMVQPKQEAKVTRELCAEVKDLTASLRLWQSAFQQAEEKYRRKCDGERVLKQTLREREGQLSSLVEKLSGYESEFQKSILNYEELMRLSAELELLEGSSSNTTSSVNSGRIISRTASSAYLGQQPANEGDSLRRAVIEAGDGMPGTFPTTSKSSTLTGDIAVDQLTVSILSWAALLATYMLS
ncbi:hypothetical protein EDD11_002435 [Mortierella claussenii]|nr:hypothetical protein EDD11_002435 [Mortierella claussenii]